ncbi:hypothetical protein GOODEAATRI_018949 [Goodea atripinnis]|uniref:Uncharacterized protein n=1 Tax=Goodea atripinnis TaxID=208336 RepID=A0ABV0NBR9_9TELE
MLLVEWDYVCSCILIITRTFSNVSVFSCTAVCIKDVCVCVCVCPVLGLTAVISTFHLIHDLLLHLWLYLISASFQALKTLHGMQCFLAVGLLSENFIQIKIQL